MNKPIQFSIIGGGFRSEFYLRIARAMPDKFQVTGMVVRDEGKGSEMERKWNVSTYRTLDSLLERERPEFAVVSVSRSACPGFLFELAERGIPALAETPPAPDLDGLLALHELTLSGAKIQVAEQYHFQPVHAAQLAIIDSGMIGSVTQATVSVSQAYHGMNMIRKLLGVGFEEAKIRAMRFESPWVAGPNRSGPPVEEKIVTSKREIAWIDYGDKLGIYDFTSDQHRSWIRSNHVSARGVRGEIFDDRLKMLADFATPLQIDLKRINRGENGNLEGYFLKGIIAGERWVYENPFAPARLYDDEIAIAVCLDKMAAYAAGGPGFYGLPDASQDHYLGLLLEEAVQTGETVTAVRQPWSEFH
ncbi:Gfo/Idh/MocA family protein [Paenibacillus radicis (ex Xue et al. 2023)]|uniref:Gfo/Idh/MocA family oxidoreductase n=1 Tax=Paenibacillus radicis (ex Xue et al. 2023) TaxID=2972489 RepID=A0ABT1YDW8_9BACL|nr:Gfo/Idh/MocA family oxidoreductase [Paenibacillus radicis (ex Xue et al. 2023)]MCR8631382.1 Gfo/Idh/MocA family oxidoreductase [Paenibacillus radicis (ex Xue et al. 2023)]